MEALFGRNEMGTDDNHSISISDGVVCRKVIQPGRHLCSRTKREMKRLKRSPWNQKELRHNFSDLSKSRFSKKAIPCGIAFERGKGGRETSGKAMQDAVPLGATIEKSIILEENRSHGNTASFVISCQCTYLSKDAADHSSTNGAYKLLFWNKLADFRVRICTANLRRLESF
jgi:hypothetical protein